MYQNYESSIITSWLNKKSDHIVIVFKMFRYGTVKHINILSEVMICSIILSSEILKSSKTSICVIKEYEVGLNN